MTLARRTGLSPMSPKRRSTVANYNRVRRDVELRAGGRCEIRSPVCLFQGAECHHRLPRSAGGQDTLENCAWTCSGCHRWLHEHPAIAYECGWLRHSWDRPA